MTSQRAHRKAKAKMYATCKVCGKPKTIPKQMQKGVYRVEWERDPYCSTDCCRADHGITSSSAGTAS